VSAAAALVAASASASSHAPASSLRAATPLAASDGGARLPHRRHWRRLAPGRRRYQ
jgi:hypothetical protein